MDTRVGVLERAGKGPQAALDLLRKPILVRPSSPSRQNLAHSKEVRRKTTHICCRFAKPLLGAPFAEDL